MLRNPTDFEIRVNQKPVSVTIECPECNRSEEINYNEFTGAYGDPPDWLGTILTCPNCGARLRIDSQDWD